MATKRTGTVKTTGTVISILEKLQELDGARVSELADELDVAKSTVSRHLTTLRELEYLTKEGDEYRLGFRFLDMGQHVRGQKEVYDMAKPIVEEIAEETNERVQFLAEEHGYTVYVHRKRGKHAVMTDPGIGKRTPIHTSAAGKSILAHLPEDRVWEIIDRHGLTAKTEHTIADPDTLFVELEKIREQGYGINDQELLDGLRAIGVPVLGKGKVIAGALSISGPTRRMKKDWLREELADLLLGYANEIELNISHA